MEIGIYCTSIRPHLWKGLYESLSQNNVDFNLCIAGPCPPTETLPVNVKYIQTNVKPPQCCFIAANNTKGEYVGLLSDDARLSPKALDNLLEIAIHEKMSIVSPVWQILGGPEAHYSLVVEWGYQRPDNKVRTIKLDFPWPIGGLMKREDFNAIGIDNNFIGTFWELDMTFEFISRGGKVIIDKNSIFTETESNSHLGAMSVGIGDYQKALDMWIDNDRVRPQRKIPIDPLIYNDTVLTVSQGPKLDCWN